MAMNQTAIMNMMDDRRFVHVYAETVVLDDARGLSRSIGECKRQARRQSTEQIGQGNAPPSL
jgi:hypothetical protein